MGVFAQCQILTNFPFVNLQIKSIVESLHSYSRALNKWKKKIFLKICILGLKIIFQEISNFSESFGLILLASLAFWKLLIWTIVAHLI